MFKLKARFGCNYFSSLACMTTGFKLAKGGKGQKGKKGKIKPIRTLRNQRSIVLKG